MIDKIKFDCYFSSLQGLTGTDSNGPNTGLDSGLSIPDHGVGSDHGSGNATDDDASDSGSLETVACKKPRVSFILYRIFFSWFLNSSASDEILNCIALQVKCSSVYFIT